MWHFLKFSPSLFSYLPILPEKSLKMSHEIRSVQTKPNIILYLKFNLGLGGLLYLLITRTSTFFSNWQYFPLATTRYVPAVSNEIRDNLSFFRNEVDPCFSPTIERRNTAIRNEFEWSSDSRRLRIS